MTTENSKILIVEDEILIAMAIKNDLQQMGHSVTAICASGEDAIKDIEAEKPVLVLMDIKIQGEIDGITTADLIQTRYNVPIIYMTAHSEDDTIERAKKTGPYGYLLKPINSKELHIAVEVTLYKHKMDNEKARLTKQLQDALEKVKLLSGILPICCSCKKIRNDEGYWEQVEVYIRNHSEAEFSHGFCLECVQKLYPEQWKRIMEKKAK